jgi:hypothetical protein
MTMYWDVEVTRQLLVTSASEGGRPLDLRPKRFIPRERALGTHLIGGCVGPEAGLAAVEKRKISFSCPKWESQFSSYV